MEQAIMHFSLDNLKSRKLDTGELLKVSYTSSGGMNGGYHSTSLSLEDKTLEVINQEWHHSDRIKKVYKVDDTTIEKIKEIVFENNMAAWSELPADFNLRAIDAPTTSMNLTYANLSTSISIIVSMDDEEREIFREVINLVYSLIKDENLVSEETLQPNEAPMMMGFVGMGMTPPKFCIKCGSHLKEGQTECSCGHKIIS
jgi:hypothetical protein